MESKLAARRQELMGVLSISMKPTFDGKVRAVEVHVLDHKAAYYGKELGVSFHRYLRPIRKFASSEERKGKLPGISRMPADSSRPA